MFGVQACSVTAYLPIDQSILFQSLAPLYSLVGQRALDFFAATSLIGLVNFSGVTLKLHCSLIHVACQLLFFLILIGWILTVVFTKI